MKFTLPKDAFPFITLSENQRAAFIEEADTVVKEIVAANDLYIAKGSKIGYPDWKFVRSKEGVQVYRQRTKVIKQRPPTSSLPPVLHHLSQPQEHEFCRFGSVDSYSNVELESEGQASSSSSSGIARNSIMDKMRPHGVALMALHGKMDGTVDDCLFGCTAATDEAWMLRSSHINDGLDDARLIEAIRLPSRTDPYQFLGVKWFAKEHPIVLTGIVHQRDFLILESTGFTRDSKGERVGYMLMHSITLRDIPELTHLGIIRGIMSFCFIFRQGGPGKVNIFCRGFFDSRGEMPNRLSVAIAAESAICCTGVVDYAYIKKLRWLIKHANKPAEITTETCPQCPQRCEACAKSLGKFTLPFSESSVVCQVCRKTICLQCSVSKKMTVHVSSSGSIQQCSLKFCLCCIKIAKEKSSLELAMIALETSASHSVGSLNENVIQ
ncbi:FYVE-FINGER-CONTAINING RAB5 EFFECTOR PROTEIN RABENOSYN-5-RELATED [Plasmopara halstedii]|uniref:FYVE-FINGER-CONTAINING RAB5 EFFECTOR PROTEIN RABENOSYN-5-RELATED n=1 Tax=Plasmopara halstedii TaxID=4781 RepID=A0A0P1AZG9_PLAHL|nr:FYVE-FINGER-CONTAINING RAB5 EFFECTOR PROTEIN RABENOSYN-5-RELATED [Plasmopara halstedii]CEG46746.1 FYVE-FINGER-CONTAINING RAB5 EFFECTOR PROTEIN RABENOSYN-5-RELATED [Plasmopara halstedii]|eukprot:XP_024583115.1 FYVE-FINGER-CONTAINING RAB5 EFFECTOR PROTEIN RABENOSYN-5-RELATED [Plasmopara halstedii]